MSASGSGTDIDPYSKALETQSSGSLIVFIDGDDVPRYFAATGTGTSGDPMKQRVIDNGKL